MTKRHINFYCNLSLLFFYNINGTQLQSLPTIVKVVREWPIYWGLTSSGQYFNNIDWCLKSSEQYFNNIDWRLTSSEQYFNNIDWRLTSSEQYFNNIDWRLTSSGQHFNNIDWCFVKWAVFQQYCLMFRQVSSISTILIDV